jgi:hypothetical protein
VPADGEGGRRGRDRTSLPAAPPERVFISYSPEDARFLKLLIRHLSVLDNQKLIKIFTVQAVPPGRLWEEITQAEISSAAVAILLVTPAYLESRALMEHELPSLLVRAAEDGTTIMPLLVKPSLFYSLPHLYRFKEFNPTPKTLIEMRAGEKDRFLVSVAEAVQEEVRRRRASGGDIQL